MSGADNRAITVPFVLLHLTQGYMPHSRFASMQWLDLFRCVALVTTN